MFFGGVSTLAEHLDQTIMVVLRDGRHLLGALSSFDQYGSLVLESARERHFARESPAHPHATSPPHALLCSLSCVFTYFYIHGYARAGGKYCDIAMGVYLVRGENIAICGVLVSSKLHTIHAHQAVGAMPLLTACLPCCRTRRWMHPTRCW